MSGVLENVLHSHMRTESVISESVADDCQKWRKDPLFFCAMHCSALSSRFSRGDAPGRWSFMRRLILRNSLSPGDIVMLTAAVRDLHLSYPGQFLTDTRTPCPALWENNPYMTQLSEGDPGTELIDCEYPLIHRRNEL